MGKFKNFRLNYILEEKENGIDKNKFYSLMIQKNLDMIMNMDLVVLMVMNW